MIEKTGIFSIGYGNRKFQDFVDILKKNHINYLVDVRTTPYSKYNPDFIKEALERNLKTCRIRYVFMGDQIGGQPNDITCYTEGKVDYDKCKVKEGFIEGVQRLVTAMEKKLAVAIMCSELKPEECHRSKLLGSMLEERGIEILHIDEQGRVLPQSEVMTRINGNQLTLFQEGRSLTSKKKYKLEDNTEGS